MNKKTPIILNSTRWFEIVAIFLTAIGKFIFMDGLNYRLFFETFAILFWIGYIVYRAKKQPGILYYWGFRTDNFKVVLKKVLPFGGLALVFFFVVGSWQGTINLTWHIIPILITYPIWGTIQQFLIIGLFTGNLQHHTQLNLSNTLNIAVSSVLFSAVHYPDKWLMLGTFFLAIIYSNLYLKERNLYVLGILHGWLGALFYYTIVNRDPFLEVFGKYL
jgi:membrane protease YdiL (CAAX protease family)